MLFKSPVYSSASGSIAGLTYSHNTFGMYTRARAVPVNPNTVFQQLVRNQFATASAAWRQLTDAQRAGWAAYAAASPTTNRVGDQIHLSGFQWFVATNSRNTLLGQAALTSAPAATGLQALGSPTVVLDASGTPSILVSDLDASMDGGTLGIFLGDAVSAGVSFSNGPYQIRASGSPSSNSLSITSATGRGGVAFVTGARIPWRLAGVTSVGRLSTVATGIATVQA